MLMYDTLFCKRKYTTGKTTNLLIPKKCFSFSLSIRPWFVFVFQMALKVEYIGAK